MATHSAEIVADEDRCRRSGGGGWRCPFRRVGELLYCEKHHERRSKKRVNPRVRVSEAEDSRVRACRVTAKKRGRSENGRAVSGIRVSETEDSRVRVCRTTATKRGRAENGIAVSSVRVSEAPVKEEGEGAIEAMELSQIWAFPHESDGCPRLYARIERLDPARSLIEVTPLIPHPTSAREIKFSEQGLALACGTFRASNSTVVKDSLSATHRALVESLGNGNLFYKIFPRKGEVWATYTVSDTDESIAFKLVEVVSDFSEEDGVRVAALARADQSENCGFYQRQMHEGFYMVRTMSDSHMAMFSHRVPASRTINNGEKCWKDWKDESQRRLSSYQNSVPRLRRN